MPDRVDPESLPPCPNQACALVGELDRGNIVRYGNTGRAVPRFKCKECNKVFAATVNSPYHRLRGDPELIKLVVGEVLSGYTIGSVAADHELPHSTLKRWVAAFEGFPEHAAEARAYFEKENGRGINRLEIVGELRDAGLITQREARLLRQGIVRRDPIVDAYFVRLAWLLVRYERFEEAPKAALTPPRLDAAGEER